LVKVHYSAINPADTRHYYMGMSEFVAGYEFVGTVLEAGPESPFKTGQDVFGFTMPGDHRPLHIGAHQEFLLAENFLTYERPKDLDPITAVTMLVGALTAIDALFNMLEFGFPLAGLSGDSPINVPILIWGGSSVVGQAAIQLAKMAGCYPILTTASPKNHEALQCIGATQCFDYQSDTVVEDIQTAMKDYSGKLTHVFDAVTTGLGVSQGLSEQEQQAVDQMYEWSSPAMARRCCDAEAVVDELHLCTSLFVAKDPSWKFALLFRTVETMDPAVGERDWASKQRQSEEAKVQWWASRIDRAIQWLITNHATYWQPPRTRIVTGGEAALGAIHDVWTGKVSREKIVVSRPL
jgi:hypothetical protein